MNIFYLDHDPRTCAEMHVDKHCVKMILEYAQLLSTAHRVLDGQLMVGVSDAGRKYASWILFDQRQDILYKSTHINHPSAIWVRQSTQHYLWLTELLNWLCSEYTHRYAKIHKVERTGLLTLFKSASPKNILMAPFTEPPPAMPDHYKIAGDAIQSYKNYYLGDKTRLFSWKKRERPSWIPPLDKKILHEA